MKIKDLVKDGWPKRKFDTAKCSKCPGCNIAEHIAEIRGFNVCLAAIEPIKEMEVEVDKEKIYRIIKLNCEDSDRYPTEEVFAMATATALAANLDKFLVVKKGKID